MTSVMQTAIVFSPENGGIISSGRAGDREFGKAERETERREERVFKGGEMEMEMGCGLI